MGNKQLLHHDYHKGFPVTENPKIAFTFKADFRAGTGRKAALILQARYFLPTRCVRSERYARTLIAEKHEIFT